MTFRMLATYLFLATGTIPHAAGQSTKSLTAPRDAGPPRFVRSVAELERWSHSVGLGEARLSEPYAIGGRTVRIVLRSFTSGVMTSDLTLWTVDREGKGLSLALHIPTRMTHMATRKVGDSIVVETPDPETGKLVVALTISPRLLESSPWPPRHD